MKDYIKIPHGKTPEEDAQIWTAFISINSQITYWTSCNKCKGK